MSDKYVDGDGSLILTYDVSVSCRGKRVYHLGSGSSAVFKFYNIVEAGIPDAVKIEYMWGYNVLVTLRGDTLIELVKKHYGNDAQDVEKYIDPSEEYVIDCYDMS